MGVRSETGKSHAISAQQSTVAMEPQVPGPGRKRPAPKNVAIRFAQSGVDPVEVMNLGSVFVFVMTNRWLLRSGIQFVVLADG